MNEVISETTGNGVRIVVIGAPEGATMMRYANLHDNGDGTSTVIQVVESHIDPDGVGAEWVACGHAGPGWLYDGTTFFAPPPPPAAVDPCEWLLDLGPFSDRLGPAASAIDLSTVPQLIAIRADFARRKWIDLKDPRVIAMVQFLAGHVHPALGTLATPLLTDAQAADVLGTKPAAVENLAVRKLYFSKG